MSEYKSIKGKTVQFLGTDPSETSTEGQVWYNSTAGAFKSLVALEAWSSGANLVTGRTQSGAAGIQTASILFGGGVSPGPTTEVETQEYNGSGWSNGGNMATARRLLMGTGTLTAGLGFGGYGPGYFNNTEEYDGTSWTAGGNLGTARYGSGRGGTQTAGLAFGGLNPGAPPGGNLDSAEEYDGSAWTAGGTMNTARRNFGSDGSQTAALGFGGDSTGTTNITESYNGSTFTTENSMNTSKQTNGGSGSSTSALSFGGFGPGGGPDHLTATENYDGTSWTISPATLAVATRNPGASGSSSTSALSAGGTTPASNNTSATEEYNKSITVFTPAAWSSGGNMLYARSNVADGGTQTAAIEGAGRQDNPDAVFTTSSEYNGSSWTSGNSLPTNYSSGTGATGTQTALITGGAAPGSTTTFEYDGTSWTTGGSLGTGRFSGKNLGTQTAAVYCGGRVTPPTLNNVEEYDGSTWTSVTAMPIAIRNGGGYGIQTAGTIVSGFQGPSTPPVSPTSSISRSLPGFDYDGTSWTAGTSALIAGASGGAAGTQTSAIYLAGENPALSPAGITTSQKYDGTAYITDASVGARSRTDGIGITSARTAEVGSAAMIFGGYNPPATPQNTNATEEYNVATSAINIKTLTTS